ncbi:MAG: hypothetical protein E7164_04050 [Firmicutes bacterium]|nr:hypothetical protein [Bacillota bacterium]
MKNATSELANLLIVVICVAILVAFFYFTIWPSIRTNFVSQTACEKAVCASTDPDGDGMVNCRLGNNIFECKYKG